MGRVGSCPEAQRGGCAAMAVLAESGRAGFTCGHGAGVSLVLPLLVEPPAPSCGPTLLTLVT